MTQSLVPMSAEMRSKGVIVAVVHSVPPAVIEAWIRAVRGWAQVEAVDWGYVGGRGEVLVLGTPEEVTRVREACSCLLPALNAMMPGLFPELRGDSLSAGLVVEETR